MGRPRTTSGFREGELRRAPFRRQRRAMLALAQGARVRGDVHALAEALAVLDRNFLDIVCLHWTAEVGEPYELPDGAAPAPATAVVHARTMLRRRARHAPRSRSSPRFPSRRLRSRSSCSNSFPAHARGEQMQQLRGGAIAAHCAARGGVPEGDARVDDPSAYVRLLR